MNYILLNYTNRIKKEVSTALVAVRQDYETIGEYIDVARKKLAASEGVLMEDIMLFDYVFYGKGIKFIGSKFDFPVNG